MPLVEEKKDDGVDFGAIPNIPNNSERSAIGAPLWRGASLEKEGITMMRKLLVLTVLTLFVTVVAPGLASAFPQGDGGGLLGILNLDTQTQIDDLFATEDPNILSSDPSTMHFGPYPSTTGDSGTCEFDWATDTMNRFFMIRQVAPMTYSVIEKFKGGTFVTPGPPPFGPDPLRRSPDSCYISDSTPPGTVADDVTGTFHGYLDMTISNATVYSPNSASCLYPCFFTDDFLISVFPAGFVRMDNAYFFHYVAVDQGLVFHEWKNASCSRGGNQGDIQSVTVGTGGLPLCP